MSDLMVPAERNERRAAFLAGEGVLSWREVVEWARELGHSCRPDVPLAMMPIDPMAVLVAPRDVGIRRPEDA